MRHLYFSILFLISTITISAETLQDSIVNCSKLYLGCSYKYGSKGPKRFDCSGFTSYIFNKFGYTLGSSSSNQHTQGTEVSVNNLQKGDLVFFKGSHLNSGVGHVGIVCEADNEKESFQFIHATVQNGVIIDEYPGLEYYNLRYIGAKRIIETHNDKVEESSKEEDIKENKIEEEIKEIKSDTLFHIVEHGDTMYRISKKYGCSIEEIQQINNYPSINIYIGQRLIIPKEN